MNNKIKLGLQAAFFIYLQIRSGKSWNLNCPLRHDSWRVPDQSIAGGDLARSSRAF
jgi:hypothetical protein